MEWTEVKAKPKTKKKVVHSDDKPTYGGFGTKGKLIAGPINQNYQQSRPAHRDDQDDDYYGTQTHASALVDFYEDQVADYDEDQHVELVSHLCSQNVSEARMKAGLSQVQLASKVNEKV